MLDYEMYQTANSFYLVASQISDQIHVEKKSKLSKAERLRIVEEYEKSGDNSDEGFRAFQDKLDVEYEDHWELYVPMIVNTAFACEVYMKFLLEYYEINCKRIHNLLELFNLLPKEARQFLLTEQNSLVKKECFIERLEEVKNAFIDWRYWYEHTSEPCASIFFLFRFANELKIYCEIIILQEEDQTKASVIIHQKLNENMGDAYILSYSKKFYKIVDYGDGKSFTCKELQVDPPYTYEVFDVIVDLLRAQGGRAKKGMGRNAKLGAPGCEDTTVVGAIGRYYAGKKDGDSIYDPVFVLAAVLEWAGIAYNKRGCLELTPSYLELYNEK